MTMFGNLPEVMNVKDVARFLKVSPDTITDECSSGVLKSKVVGKRKRVIMRDWLIEYMFACREEVKAPTSNGGKIVKSGKLSLSKKGGVSASQQALHEAKKLRDSYLNTSRKRTSLKHPEKSQSIA